MPAPMLELYSHRADLVVEHFVSQAAHLHPDLAPFFGLVRSDPAAFSASYADHLSHAVLPTVAPLPSWKKRLPIWINKIVGGLER